MTTTPPGTTPPPGRKAPRFTRDDPEIRRAKLITAAIRCLQEGGMSAFRIDRICRKAKVSHGLIAHYFPAKNDLLVAVYRAVFYDDLNFQIARLDAAPATDAESRLGTVVEAMLSPNYTDTNNPAVWLALWGEIAANPALRAAHQALYQGYRRVLADAIEGVATSRGHGVHAETIARNAIALVDGLSLEHALDPPALSPQEVRAACFAFLELHLGPLRW